jgi:TatD DNase family protein
MPITDSHCHLASTRFDPREIAELLERAENAGVHRVVTLATSLLDLPRNLELANDRRVHACIGIHPCDVTNAPDDAVEQLALHTADTRVCAIGETGLDYYHPAPDGWTDENYRARQRDFLTRHFELAARAKLNVIIHTRDRTDHASFDDALAIYQEFASEVRAVFHCFAGPWENAQRVIALGGLVSFGGTCTFKNAASIRETLTRCPAGTFLLETDAPYLAPEPHRGTRNEPAFTAHTANRAAETRLETLDDLAIHTEAACNAFFRFRSEIR